MAGDAEGGAGDEVSSNGGGGAASDGGCAQPTTAASTSGAVIPTAGRTLSVHHNWGIFPEGLEGCRSRAAVSAAAADHRGGRVPAIDLPKILRLAGKLAKRNERWIQDGLSSPFKDGAGLPLAEGEHMAREAIWFGQNLITPLVRGEETDGRFTLVELEGPPGDQPPLHMHSEVDEGFFVLTGEMTLWAGNQQVTLGPGEFFHAPRNVPHTYRVSDAGPARWLITASPAGFEAFVARVGEPASDRRLPDPAAPPDAELLARIAAEHGIQILGPPGALPS